MPSLGDEGFVAGWVAFRPICARRPIVAVDRFSIEGTVLFIDSFADLAVRFLGLDFSLGVWVLDLAVDLTIEFGLFLVAAYRPHGGAGIQASVDATGKVVVRLPL